ncbi:MAG: AmmeMemoRadiSam system radical SAM enzyme [Pseudomonadota bacterium]|nr:AmmeMemoRadiSam system radical SAM enzyme [Pseudomonadota bacterium]
MSGSRKTTDAGLASADWVNPESPFIHATEFWHSLDDGRVQCDVCPRACKLREGQRGLCFVRANLNGAVVSTTYGRSSGFCVDPIEKKPLNHFYPGSSVLSFGTAGCNLSCKFCQNWDISKSRETDTLASKASPEMIARAAAEAGCQSVAYTYNDPVIFQEYAVDVAQACREQGIKSVAVSAGYHCPQAREQFYQYMDAANIDLKSFDEDFYWKLTGAHLGPVLETLEYLRHETNVWFEITTLVIPGHNDSPAELEAMCQWIRERLGADVPLHFSAFHPDYKMQDVPATPLATLTRARDIALAQGLQYVYTGNVHHQAGDTTWCPGCGEAVIERDWYQLSGWGLDLQGRCQTCGTAVAGRFAAKPGNWGRRRVPVRFSE